MRYVATGQCFFLSPQTHLFAHLFDSFCNADSLQEPEAARQPLLLLLLLQVLGAWVSCPTSAAASPGRRSPHRQSVLPRRANESRRSSTAQPSPTTQRPPPLASAPSWTRPGPNTYAHARAQLRTLYRVTTRSSEVPSRLPSLHRTLTLTPSPPPNPISS